MKLLRLHPRLHHVLHPVERRRELAGSVVLRRLLPRFDHRVLGHAQHEVQPALLLLVHQIPVGLPEGLERVRCFRMRALVGVDREGDFPVGPRDVFRVDVKAQVEHFVRVEFEGAQDPHDFVFPVDVFDVGVKVLQRGCSGRGRWWAGGGRLIRVVVIRRPLFFSCVLAFGRRLHCGDVPVSSSHAAGLRTEERERERETSRKYLAFETDTRNLKFVVSRIQIQQQRRVVVGHRLNLLSTRGRDRERTIRGGTAFCMPRLPRCVRTSTSTSTSTSTGDVGRSSVPYHRHLPAPRTPSDVL